MKKEFDNFFLTAQRNREFSVDRMYVNLAYFTAQRNKEFSVDGICTKFSLLVHKELV